MSNNTQASIMPLMRVCAGAVQCGLHGSLIASLWAGHILLGPAGALLAFSVHALIMAAAAFYAIVRAAAGGAR